MFSDARFRAMGSDVHLVVHGSQALVDLAVTRLAALEAAWSRFRPDSEISRLNAGAGRWLEVSAPTALLLQRAVEGWRLTGGAYDPLLLHALQAAGYDRSFEALDPALPAVPPARWWNRPLPPEIEVNGSAARIPAGAGFDPGGIGKGLAADLVTADLMAAGAVGVCVSVGGDVRVRGTAPGGTPWTIAVEHPLAAAPVTLVGLWDGALATSSVLRRVWQSGGRPRHHIIEPDTGVPARTTADLASVIAGDGWLAEVLTKPVLLRPADRRFDNVPSGCAALAVVADGTVAATASMSRFTGGALVPTVLRSVERTHPGGAR